MEGDTFNTIQADNSQTPATTAALPKLSFIPDSLAKKYEGPLGLNEKCAYAGLVVGVIAAASWIVIILGLIVSIIGVTLSVTGLKSNRSKYARIGLVLSIVGLVGSLGYAFAAYQGRVNYNYFTTEFWGATRD